MGRVINIEEDNNNKIQLSLRDSVVNEHNWKSALSKATGTTMQYKKLFAN